MSMEPVFKRYQTVRDEIMLISYNLLIGDVISSEAAVKQSIYNFDLSYRPERIFHWSSSLNFDGMKLLEGKLREAR